MDPGAPNSGKRFESSHQIFSPELRTISVAPPVSLSFRFLVNILIRHCFMLDPMILYGEQCLWFSILERGSSLCFWWAFPVSLSTKTGAGSQRASLGLVEGTKSRAGRWKTEVPGTVLFMASYVVLRDERSLPTYGKCGRVRQQQKNPTPPSRRSWTSCVFWAIVRCFLALTT